MSDPVTPPRTVLMSVSLLLGNLLRGALTSLGNVEVVIETNPVTYAGVPPHLIVLEVTTETEGWVQELLEQPGSAPLILIGPLSRSSERPRLSRESNAPRDIRELSADVSVAEIVRVCGEYLGHEAPNEGRPVRSWPSNPFDFDVVPRESAAGIPSLQAPLFPLSAPPSSHPSKRPSSGAPAGEDAESGAFDLDPELSALLAETESRVAGELSPRLTSPPDPVEEGARSDQFFLSPEVRSALEEPVERYHERPQREHSHASGTPNSQWATRTGIGNASRKSEVASSGTGELSAPGPTSVGGATGMPGGTARVKHAEQDEHAYEASLEPAPPAPGSEGEGEPSESATTRPPPAALSRKALMVPAVPPPPAVPHDSWQEHRDGNTPFEVETVAPASAYGSDESDEAATSDESVTRDARPTDQPRRSAEAQPSPALFPGPTAPSAGRQMLPIHDTAQPSAPDAVEFEESQFPSPAKRVSELPPLGQGDTVELLARAIRTRYTGTIVIEADGGVRRLVMRDGDFVTAASGLPKESLLAFLVARGTLSPQVAHRLEHRLPSFGRHAGAALIAAGHLTQEQLWPCLRAHAEHIISEALQLESGIAGFEDQVAERLANEPAVFGGATGAEVFVELVRRVVSTEVALVRLGGKHSRLAAGQAQALLDECALPPEEFEALTGAVETNHTNLGELLVAVKRPGFAAAVYALVQLRIISIEAGRPAAKRVVEDSSLDEQAARELVANRKALVEEGDYFQLLGLHPHATAYDIRRAYVDLKRTFQSGPVLAPALHDLRDDVELISAVLDEAYDILHDHTRRERYRKALLSSPE